MAIEQINTSYYAILTADIRYSKELTSFEKLLFAEITALIHENGCCSVSTAYFARLFGKSQHTVSKAIFKMETTGFIKITQTTDEEAYRKLNNMNSKFGCLFCGYAGIAIDKHHYPVRAKDGGIRTIDLCSNCHREFHHITDFTRDGIVINWFKHGITREEYGAAIEGVSDGN